jgi:putative ABC transport system ATP-binding protein
MLQVRGLDRPGLHLACLDLAAGECVAIRGPSGAGKTLLLRALADLDPSRGEVSLDDRSRDMMPAPSWRRLVTYVAGEPGWWADTVGEHIADWPKAVLLLTSLGLPEGCRTWPIARLSSGERQRVGLIRALIQQPHVLLLDEPTASLDEDGTAAVERLISSYLADGGAVLWVTHDPAQARRVAHRCLMVERGQVTERSDLPGCGAA